MKMGFPQYINEGENKPSMCVCHLDDEPNFGISGYFCPQCNSKYCDLPVECKVCGLTLVSASHLARSYHHLFPVDSFSEQTLSTNKICAGCLKELSVGKTVVVCPNCKKHFCIDCDVFIHDVSHVCPGCSSISSKYSTWISKQKQVLNPFIVKCLPFWLCRFKIDRSC